MFSNEVFKYRPLNVCLCSSKKIIPQFTGTFFSKLRWANQQYFWALEFFLTKICYMYMKKDISKVFAKHRLLYVSVH